MPLFLEKYGPVLAGAAVGILYLLVPNVRQYRLPESLSALMAAMVTIGGIAVGFLATAKAILVSIDDRPIIRRLKQTPYYKRIMGYMRAAISWSFFLTIWSALALLVDLKDPTGHALSWTVLHSVGFAIWLWLAITATLAYYRVISIFYAILATLD